MVKFDESVIARDKVAEWSSTWWLAPGHRALGQIEANMMSDVMDKMLPTLCVLCQLDTIFLSDNARDYVILWTIRPRGPHCQVIAFKTSKHKSAANQFYLKVNWYIPKVAILKVCIFFSKYAKVIEYYMHVSFLTLSPIMVKDLQSQICRL